MISEVFPAIDAAATGSNIRRMRMERGYTIRDIQSYFGFEEPRAIYKWQRGDTLPSLDNLYALCRLFQVPMEQVIVPLQPNTAKNEQQADACCSGFYYDFILFQAIPLFSFGHP